MIIINKNINISKKNIIFFLFILIFLLILICIIIYFMKYKNKEPFEDPSTTIPYITDTVSTSTMYQSIPFGTIENNIVNIKKLPAIGPCKQVIIRAGNFNLAGILILNQYGNNIFNNYYVKLEPEEIKASYVLMNFTDGTTSAELKNVSSLFNQTSYMHFDNEKCNFETKDQSFPSPKNLLHFRCTNLNNKSLSRLYEIDKSQMFTTPINKVTELTIDIPQIANNNPLPSNMSIPNINISRIILFLNDQIDNTDMLKTLEIKIKKTDNSDLASWSIDTENLNIKSEIITFSLPSTNNPSTTLGTSNFKNINSKPDKFININSKPDKFINIIDIIANMVSNNDIIPAPLDTNTTQPLVTETTPTGTGTTPTGTGTTPSGTGTTPSGTGTTPTGTGTTPSGTGTTPTGTTPTGTGTSTTRRATSSTMPITTYGYKIQNSQNTSESGPQSNIYQKNFEGTSNIYTPYIYYNMEEFSPLNLYDNKYSLY